MNESTDKSVENEILTVDQGPSAKFPKLTMTTTISSSTSEDNKSPKSIIVDTGMDHVEGQMEENQTIICSVGDRNVHLNPLLDIDHILKKILSCLKVKDLKSANLVCKTWYNQATKLLVLSQTLNFSNATALEFVQEPENLVHDLSIKNYIFSHPISLQLNLEVEQTLFKLRKSSKLSKQKSTGIDIPTANVLLSYLQQRQVIFKNLSIHFHSTQIAELWAMLSSLSDSLDGLCLYELCDAPPPEFLVSTDDPNRVERNLVPFTLPRLMTLKGKVTKNTTNSWGFNKLFRQLITQSPLLETLDFQGLDRELLSLLQEKPDCLQNLKSLKCVTLNQEEMRVLHAKNLQMQQLSFNLYSGFRVKEMSTLLSSWASTLRTLEIDFENLPKTPERFRCGPDLVNLTHLTLTMFYGSIHFISRMPHLVSLSLYNVNLSVALHDEASKYSYTSKLQSLEIYGGQGSNGRFLFPVYTLIVRFFPDLRVFRMEYMTDTTLKIVVSGLKNLEELCIPNGIYTDKLLVGNIACDDDAGDNQDNVSLVQLKRLRKLYLQSPRITDVGVKQGLLNMRELRSLSINSPVISDDSLKLICTGMLLHEAQFNHCYRLSSNAIAEAKKSWDKEGKLSFKF